MEEHTNYRVLSISTIFVILRVRMMTCRTCKLVAGELCQFQSQRINRWAHKQTKPNIIVSRAAYYRQFHFAYTNILLVKSSSFLFFTLHTKAKLHNATKTCYSAAPPKRAHGASTKPKKDTTGGISYQARIAATITINITRLGWTRYSYSVAIRSSHPIIELQNSLSTRQSIETS